MFIQKNECTNSHYLAALCCFLVLPHRRVLALQAHKASRKELHQQLQWEQPAAVVLNCA
jgi:hypothetical protein